MSTVEELIQVLRHELKPGETIEAKIFRKKREEILEVTLVERPSQ